MPGISVSKIPIPFNKGGGINWSSYWTTRLKNKTIGFWRMNEASGDAVDSLGLHDGIATSVYAYEQSYGVANGFQFVQDGTKRRVYCGAISSNKYSISLWELKGTYGASQNTIFGVGGNYTGLFVEFNSINLVDSSGNNLATWTNALAINSDYAHHLILEVDVVAGTAELYYDLVSLGKKNCLAPALSNFVIANSYANGSFFASRAFSGILGNVGVFDGFLTLDEKGILFNEYKSNYYPFSVYENIRGGRVIFTFDDGYKSYKDIVHPIFTGKNKRGTFFITTDVVGSTYDSKPCMSWAEIKELSDYGHEVASHGKTHTPFTSLTEGQLRVELDAVDAAFTANSIPLADTVAYPSGATSAAVKLIVDDYYRMARGVGGTSRFFPYDAPVVDKFEITSINAGTTTYDDTVKLIDTARYRGSVIVLMLHNVVESAPAAGEITSEHLSNLLKHCVDNKMNVITFNELYDYLA